MKSLKEEIAIEPFKTLYAEAFYELNSHWIKKYFWMEDTDHEVLGKPEQYIIEPGGEILNAIYNDEVVGVCALIKSKESVYDYELSKMAVREDIQAMGIGKKLGEAIISLAKEKGSSMIYLDSNTKLAPAIKLYRQLGFKEVMDFSSMYERTNIRMELKIL